MQNAACQHSGAVFNALKILQPTPQALFLLHIRFCRCVSFSSLFIFFAFTVSSILNIWLVQLYRALVAFTTHSYASTYSHINNSPSSFSNTHRHHVLLEILHHLSPGWLRGSSVFSIISIHRSIRDQDLHHKLYIHRIRLHISRNRLDRQPRHAHHPSRRAKWLPRLLPQQHQGKRRRHGPVPVPPQGMSTQTIPPQKRPF
jgi:hypothetical protein